MVKNMRQSSGEKRVVYEGIVEELCGVRSFTKGYIFCLYVAIAYLYAHSIEMDDLSS